MPRSTHFRSYALRVLSITLLTAFIGWLALPGWLVGWIQPTAQAASIFTVTSTGDGADSDLGDGACNDGVSNCTLRAAIQQANATVGMSTITFTVAGTINLTGALPDVATDMTIDGPGANVLTVRRNTSDNYRIFTVTAGVQAGIAGLTISGGDPGGSNGGGGIRNSGTLNLTAVTVSENNAIGGGGIQNQGTLVVTNSTISSNAVGFGTGGGIFNGNTLNLVNSTVSGNNGGSGSGGGISNFGTLNVTNSTISDNSNRGIVNLGSNTAILAGSIVANNTGSSNSMHDLSGAFISNGFNLIEAPDDASISNAQNPGTNIIGQDPKLGPLADNGGPTKTHALLAGSPAIDKGKNFATDPVGNPIARDQRGAPRPFVFPAIPPAVGGDDSDIGAFELNPPAETISEKTTNEDTTLTFSFFIGDQTVSSVTATSQNQTLVPDANVSVTGSGAGRTVQVTPVANLSGTTFITIRYTGSADGNASRVFRLTVTPINDAPSFTKGGDQIVLEDAGPQTVATWATAISAGPSESTQSLSFLVIGNTNPALFSAGPSISPTGTLTYTPAPNANGSASVTITLKDNGGTANGGQDTSPAQTFNISITPVNDPPVATGQTVAADEDTPKLITLDGSDVDGDALTFQIVSAPSHGNLSGTGASRTYTPAADFNGADSFTYKVIDTSGTESALATVTIAVAAVNDAPVNAVPGPQVTARDTPLVFSAANSNAVSTSDVDAENGAVRVTLSSSGGTLTLGSVAGLTFVSGDGVDDNTMTFTGTIASVNAALNGLTFKPNAGFDGAASLQIATDDQGFSGAGGGKSDTDSVSITVARSLIEFSQSAYTVAEGAGSLAVTVRRAGDTSQAASVDYATDDGSINSVPVPCSTVAGIALDRCDFTRAQGTLRFGVGEIEKTFIVLVSDDAYVEGTETVFVRLSNVSSGAVQGPQASATIEITDDAQETAANPIDDSGKFVRQHYHDFLNREPDASGFAFWINEIESCGANAQCREIKRINVSAAFFLSIEFQQTGFLVERAYKTAFGDATGSSTLGGTPHTLPVPIIRLNEFLPDTQQIGQGVIIGQPGADALLEANKRAYFDDFVTRPAFVNTFGVMSNKSFVDTLLGNAVLDPTVGNINVARLSGSQQVPPNDAPGTGVVILRRDANGVTRDVTISLLLNGLSSAETAAHIHGPGTPGVNAPALITLPVGEFTDLPITLTPQQVNFLNNGQLYVDVHTQTNPDGEIRAQLPQTRFRVDVLKGALDNEILTRAQVLRIVAESQELKRNESNAAFVLMQYFGYLRRNPNDAPDADYTGYDFWLSKLNQFNGNFISAEMVKAFISSAEYRQRFGQ